MRGVRVFLICITAMFGALAVIGRPRVAAVAELEKLVKEEQYQRAGTALQHTLGYFLERSDFDTLSKYISVKGAIVNGQQGQAAAIASVYSFIDLLRTRGATEAQLAKAYNRGGYFFFTINRFSEAYAVAEHELSQAMRIKPYSPLAVSRAYFFLAEFAGSMGNTALSLKHHRTAYEIRLKHAKELQDVLQESMQAIARVMLLLSRVDSAAQFYEQAVQLLAKMPATNENKFQKPANIYKNLAIISNSQGRSDEAIRYSNKAITLFRTYIREEKKTSLHFAKVEMCIAIDNLSIYYSQLGNVSRANDLLLYSYELKKASLPDDHLEILRTEVLLGSNLNNIGDYDKARYYLAKAIDRAKTMEGGALFSLADAWYIMASINDNTRATTEAGRCFAVADSLYEIAYQGAYDEMYLDFARNMCLFSAKTGNYRRAIEKSGKLYAYLRAKGEGESIQGLYQLINMARVHYRGQQYKEAIRYSNQALGIVDRRLKAGSSKLDSVRWEMYKPKCMLVKAMSTYMMQPKKDPSFLRAILSEMDGALLLLERRTGLLEDVNSINFAVEANADLIDFAKKISLELHRLTPDSRYLEQFINLHESGLYTRIRGRLDQERAAKFTHVPPALLAEEAQLKAAMNSAMADENRNGDQIRDYLANVKRWETHIEKVKQQHPEYYRLRYASLFRPLPDLHAAIPGQTTLVRYYFVDSNLVALVADRKTSSIISLSAAGLDERIQQFLSRRLKETDQLKLLHELYTQLWAPLAPHIRTVKVMIIPDGILYNLGFDMLPVTPVKHYKQLAGSSLLARHAISYHYNAFMLEGDGRRQELNSNYVAFAPGFSDELKNDYVDKIKDSLNIDQGYMTLLPQPTARNIARKIREMIGGDIFLDRSSTQASFRQHAGNHKLIHIATHAQYNNACPEKSGLIFAKDLKGTDSNWLYLSDIYNCNLSSDVTVLTACESGRPGYQDGEGMVSLAHAFNYAGSRNILTALWKIDEQASGRITESFIGYLKEGRPTDEALRQAKLDYLKQADGRLADPGYWSGLVLLGKPLKVAFSEERSLSAWWAAGGLLLISGSLLFVSFRRRHRKAA